MFGIARADTLIKNAIIAQQDVELIKHIIINFTIKLS